MSEHTQLLEAIAQHITEVYDGDNWTDVNVKNTLQDVALEEANTKTKASPNTIATILYHMLFYTKVIHQRLNGFAYKINDANGYDMPPLQSEENWQLLIQQSIEAAYELANAVKNMDAAMLYEPIILNYSSAYKQLHGVTEHAYYHLGQIIILKKLLRAG